MSESDVRDEVASEMRELLCQMEANYKVPYCHPLSQAICCDIQNHKWLAAHVSCRSQVLSSVPDAI